MTDTLIPHILALDTAQEDCGAAILLADGSLFMHVEHVGSRHSERLLPMVRDLIHEAGIEKTDLGLIAFGEGPGSFTGLRVACGAAQGLAWALEVPVAQVSNLEALADWLRETHLEAARPGTLIAFLNDARMHECYAGMWRVPAAAEDRLERLDGPVLVAPEDAQTYLERFKADMLCGSGSKVYSEAMKIRSDGGIRMVNAADSRPDAIARIARRMALSGGTIRPELAHPVYVRNRVALTMAERAAGERL